MRGSGNEANCRIPGAFVRVSSAYKKGLPLLFDIPLSISINCLTLLIIYQILQPRDTISTMSLINKAAWLDEANTPLQVRDAPMPVAGPNELVIRNAAVAINPVDTHMQKVGVFVQQWPTILGCDVSGEVQEVGPEAQGRFKKGDRVIG